MDHKNPEIENLHCIRVVGVGGGGGNAVTRMAETGLSDIVDFIIVNSDAQALLKSRVRHKIQIGPKCTKGLGAGADPGVGLSAANESAHEIEQALEGSDMVFITVGMGGGTGTGAAPIVAEIAKSLGALTVGVVTKPFAFEGKVRRSTAEEGIAVLRGKVDSLIVIPNDQILKVAGPDTRMEDAFMLADDILLQGVKGISDLIVQTGAINADFADVKTVMTDGGTALIGIGEASGEHRAVEAAQAAINSPLLEYSIDGAQRILLSIAAARDTLKLSEATAAAEIVTSVADENANIIYGTYYDDSLGDKFRVTVLATGFGEAATMRVSQPIMSSRTAIHREQPVEAIQETQVVKKFKPQVTNDPDIPLFLRDPGQ